MIYRQPTGLPWDARSIIFVQPSGKLLLAREFARGVDPFPPYPNGQTLEGGTEGWEIWDPNDIGGAAWVDAGRQAGMLEVAALDSFGRGFTGPYVAAPAVPAGAETYAYTAYGRPFQVDSLASVEDLIESRFGLFLSFANLPAEGPFILGGVSLAADDATEFPGSSRQQRTTTIVQTMTALGGTAVIPGPAAGFVRVLQGPCMGTLDGSLTPLATTCVLNPGAFPMGTNATQAVLFNTVQMPVLGVGETLNLTNNCATAVQLTYSYYDIPDTGITLVRTRFANVPVTIIPAPPVGFWRRELLLEGSAGQNNRTVIGCAVPYNCDTAAARWGYTLGAVQMNWSTSAVISMSGNPLPVPGMSSITVTPVTGDLKISTFAPVATAQNTYMGGYETFSD